MTLAIRQVHVGDCRELLRQMPDESVNCVVTSPPYWGLRDYGVAGQIGPEETVEGYVETLLDVFREVHRVLRADGTLWLNLGDSYAQGGRGGIGEASTIEGGHSNQNESRRAQSARTRGHRGERLANGRGDHPAVLRNKADALAHPRLPSPGFKPKDLIGIPWRVAFALQAAGWWLRADIVWHKPNPMPESVTDRPTKAHEYVFLLSKSATYYYDAEAIKEPVTGGAHHRGKGLGKKAAAPGSGIRSNTSFNAAVTELVDERNKRSVWTIPSQSYAGAHFATFPEKIVEPCIMAGCPAGGVVLDPFGGSGTVGEVAEALGRNWILFDLNPAYADLARARTAQRGLFVDTSPPPALEAAE